MKLDRRYKGIGRYYTLDARFCIMKLGTIQAYSIKDMETRKELNAEDYTTTGIGILMFSTIKEAADFLEKHFYPTM